MIYLHKSYKEKSATYLFRSLFGSLAVETALKWGAKQMPL
jgi:hypothetical protein